MSFSSNPKRFAKRELAPLIIAKCHENSFLYKDMLMELCEELGRIPDDDFTDEIAVKWRATYCNSVAHSTVEELDEIFPDTKQKFLAVLKNPELFNLSIDLYDLESGIPATVLYIVCAFILTGKEVSYGSARSLSVEQTEIMNRAIIDAFESLPDSFEETHNIVKEEDDPLNYTDLTNTESIVDALRAQFKKYGIVLSEDEIQYYAEMFYVISALLHHKLSFMELYTSYDFLSDVIAKQAPQFAIDFPQEEIISVQCRALEHLAETAGKLTMDEKLRYAFCVFYSLYIRIFDEKSGEDRSGLSDFKSPEHIEQCFQEHREMVPEYYSFSNNTPSNHPVSGTFGFSADNPIPVVSVQDAYNYLNCLSKPGYEISYKRIRACDGPNGIIDKYQISAVPDRNHSAEPELFEIYIDPYAQENSFEAPDGFVLNISH